MAILPDSALPDCTNPQHPVGMPRRMFFLQSRDHALVFACQACRDVNHRLSIRVMTERYYQREVRRQLAAENRLPLGPLRPRRRIPHELGLMRELAADAAHRRSLTTTRTIDWDPARRRSRDGRYELVEYKDLGNGNLQIQMAVGGRLAPQMDDHVASREEFRTEEQYWTRLARASELMLHLYGDPRAPLTAEESKQREQEMY